MVVGEMSTPFREQASAGKDSVRMQSKSSNHELDTVVVVPRDLGSRGRMRFGGVRLRELVLAGKSVLVNVYGKARHDDDDEK